MKYEEKKRRVVAVIKEIVELVNAAESSVDPGRDLWDILTALRGPDDGNERDKNLYTIPIRGHLGFVQTDAGGFYASKRHPLPYLSTVYSHFFAHAGCATSAMRRLGLYTDQKEEACPTDTPQK